MNLLLSTLEQGLIYAVLAMGVHLTFKVLNIADMSVEGSFAFGALVSAALITAGVNPMIATLAAFIAGIIPGLIAATLHIKIKINPLLAGILTMTMFYSINLKVNGRPNVPMPGQQSIFDLVTFSNKYIGHIVILFVIVFAIKFLLDSFFKTKMGYMLISTGDNKDLVTSLGESPNKYHLVGLMLANALVGLSGSLFAQSIRFADTQMGVGSLVIALASLIIGDSVFRNTKLKGTSKAILGALIYKAIGTIALELGLEANDLKLINAMIIVVFIAYNNSYGKIRQAFTNLGGRHASDKELKEKL